MASDDIGAGRVSVGDVVYYRGSPVIRFIERPAAEAKSASKVSVNSNVLTIAEAITLRVAVTDLQSRMSYPDALGTDVTGRTIAGGYYAAATAILKLLFEIGCP